MQSMHLTDAITDLQYSKDWTKPTALWYASRLGDFAAWASTQGVTTLEAIDPSLVRRYMAHLQTRPRRHGGRLDSHTINGHIRPVRTLLFWAVAEGLIDERIPRRIKPPKKEEKVLKVFSDEQLKLLMDAAKLTDTPLRDTALLYLLLDTGCRASELCGLRLQDVTFTADSAWILVHGKGRKQREVALGKKARLALSRYLHRERKASDEEERVFLGRKGPLAPEGLDRLLYRLRDVAGAVHFEGVSVAAHRWRHTHAVRSLEGGMDVFVLSKQMGHSEISTTTNYLKATAQRRLREMTISPLDTLGRSSGS